MRKALTIICLCLLTAGFCSAQSLASFTKVRARVIIDNDFGGDPDGLFHLAHHLLSPTSDVRAIVCSHHYTDFYTSPGNTEYSSRQVKDLLATMNLGREVPVLQGSDGKLSDRNTYLESAGARKIVEEAMREDTDLPLFVLCGAGLTNIASAYLMEPKIADKVTVVWIGGVEYPGICPATRMQRQREYNQGIDPVASQVVFNDSSMPLWQIPRDVYRQVLCSITYLDTVIRDSSRTGAFLCDKLISLLKNAGGTLGEAYVLGDSPLVLVTALQSSWECDSSSSKYEIVPCPKINDDGFYEPSIDGRPIRVYTYVDTQLILDDMFAKFSLLGSGSKKK